MTLDQYLATHTGPLEQLIHDWLNLIVAAVEVRQWTDDEIDAAWEEA